MKPEIDDWYITKRYKLKKLKIQMEKIKELAAMNLQKVNIYCTQLLVHVILRHSNAVC